LDKIHVVLLKGIVILSAAAWLGDEMQASETSTGTVAQLLIARHYCRNAK